jgi:CBS domain-containing protein
MQSIATRIYDFLKIYPPFNLLDKATLLQVAGKVVVQHFEPHSTIFVQEQSAGKYFYVVREGAVQLLRKEGEEDILADECEEGDLFGLRPLLAGQSYAFTSITAEESLLYAIPVETFIPLLEKHPQVGWYLAKSFASDAGTAYSNLHKGRLFLEQGRYFDSQYHLFEVFSLKTNRAPVVCSPTTSIKEAAKQMAANEVGSIVVVDERQYPLGIITDGDLRKKVVTGIYPIENSVSGIMSSPVITSPSQVTVADLQIQMVKNHIHHLVLTEDGTPESKVLGVLSEHDLLVIQGNNPATLVTEIERSHSAAELRRIRERSEKMLEKYIYQEVSISFICDVMSEINDMLTRQCINLCIQQLEKAGKLKPDVPFCWLSLGSAGRKEQLLRTDQDSALLFDNVPAGKLEATHAYFLSLAQKVTESLFEVGYDYCPGNMMSSNPAWCKSLDGWKDQFAEWIMYPTPQNIRYCTIFLDYRNVYDHEHLTTSLTEHIYKVVDLNPGFLSFLAKSALENPPPLSFFRNFVVERSGEHKDEFDIKKRAMVPLTDAGRALIMDAKLGKINSTIERFEKIAAMEPKNKELFQAAADAYEMLIRYRTLQGLKNKNSGRFFKIEELSKMERLNLRNCFRPIQEIQTLLGTRFQLSYLRG